MNILIKQPYKSIPKNLEINDLPEFVIITGENGSGKTHLLEYLQINGLNNIPRNLINWIPSDWKASSTTQNKQNRNKQTYEQKISNIKQMLINYFKQRQSTPQQQYELYLEEIAQHLNEDVNELTEEDIKQNIPYDIQNKLLVESDFISLFTMWRYDYDSKCGVANQAGDDATLKKLQADKAPWKIINELFETYNFDYRLSDPTDQNGQFNSLFFYHKNTSLKIRLNDLSSGEQMIAMLILWSYHPNTGNRCQLLLLDEPDAFLHPSMCDMLIKILFKKMHKEYGIKIIMSTHSPSTIAYSPEESIYFMQKTGDRFKKTSKAEAIKELSSGMIAFTSNDSEEKISLVYKIQNSEKDGVILVEGESDISHISAAHKKLQSGEPNFEIIPLGGIEKIRNFLASAPEKLFGAKKIIGVFDADEAGINIAKKFKGKSDETHKNCYLYQDNMYYMTLPVPHKNMYELKSCPIEMLYPLNLLKNHQMVQRLALHTYNRNKAFLNSQLGSDEWKNLDERWCYKLDGSDSAKKKYFAQQAKDFKVEHFGDFKLLFEQINFLIER